MALLGIFEVSLIPTAKMSQFLIFFYETKGNILVIMQAKFEVNSCCGWDFSRRGDLPHPCTRGLR